MSSSIIIEPEANAFVHDYVDAYGLHMAINKTSEQGSRPYIMEVGQMKVDRHPSTMISYVRFNLTKIPRSNLLTDVSIDSAVLTALLNDSIGTPGVYIMTVSYCNINSWDETILTGITQPCHGLTGVEPHAYYTIPLDSILVRTNELPMVGTWTVTEGLSNAMNNTRQDVFTAIWQSLHGLFNHGTPIQPRLTLKITAQKTNLCFSCRGGGYIDLISKEAKGFYVGPPLRLQVNYTSAPSDLKNVLDIVVAIVLPMGAAIWGIAHWMYHRGKQHSQPRTTG
jgi:hypothetical protein